VTLLPVEFARGARSVPNLPQGVDLAIHAERFKEFQISGKLDGKSVSLKRLSNLHLV
jgi:hypothetical protein